MKYTVKPSGSIEIFSRGLAKVFVEDASGRRDEIGDYKNSMLPNGNNSHRVFYDTSKGKYDIDLTDEELNAAVRAMSLSDPKTKIAITSANRHNEYDPFFIHEELVLRIPNSGTTLDDETPIGKFWLKAIESEPHKFKIDNGTGNPALERIQEFQVITSRHSEVAINEEVNEGMEATSRFHSIYEDYQKMIFICQGMDIEVGSEPKIGVLRSAIYQKITTEKDFKTKDGVRYIDRFFELTDMSKPELEIRAKVSEAISLGIISKVDRRLNFNGEFVGFNAEEAYRYFSNDDNIEAQSILFQMIASRGGGIIFNEEPTVAEVAKKANKKSTKKETNKEKVVDKKETKEEDALKEMDDAPILDFIDEDVEEEEDEFDDDDFKF